MRISNLTTPMAAIVLAKACAASAAPATPATDEAIDMSAQSVAAFVDTIARNNGAFPAIAVVIATPDRVPLMHVRGTVRAGSAVPVTAQSDFYIASQTKAFVGLTAARLDQRHILSLDTTLAQVWPQLRLPGSADPAKITMRDLLTHQAPLKTDRLNFATAYVRSIPPAEFAGLLATETTTRDPGFSYANLGYLIYGAALEARTGHSWRYWLKREVLTPLRLAGVRTNSPSNPSSLVWSHQWTNGGWTRYAPKPAAIKHSAGGLTSTPAALAQWIQANLAAAKTKRRLAPAITASQARLVKAELSDGEIKCDGYSLGWYVCGYKDEPFLLSTGEFVGTQSFTIVMPRRQVGMSLVASSDSHIQRASLELIKAFIGMSGGDAGEQARLDRAAAAYPGWVKALTDKRAAALRTERADSEWGGWSWRPTAAEEARIVGHYSNPVLGPVEVVRNAAGLSLRATELSARLEPSQPNQFAAWTNWSLTPEKLTYDSATASLMFGDWRLQRVR